MELEQLKSHLSAGCTNVSFISHIHVHFLSSVTSLIVLLMLSPPSLAFLPSLVPNVCILVGEFHSSVLQKNAVRIFNVSYNCGESIRLD